MAVDLLVFAVLISGQNPGPSQSKLEPELLKSAQLAADKAIAFYRSQQGPNGSLAPKAGFELGITGLAVAGMMDTKRIPATDPMIVKAMGFLETFVQPDGGIYPKGQAGQQNYLTSVALLAFVATNKDGQYQSTINRAIEFLKGMQWHEQGKGISKVDPNDIRYGGFGYDSKNRPDLSNTSFTIEALTSAGLPKDDPAVQRAMVFLRRCQNYTGEGGNDKAKGTEADMDGGFIYSPSESKSPAGISPTGGLRSYASMTYAGLKSFIFAGMKKDDPRIQAALGWIKNHYSIKENPGMGQSGLFYYYQTFAKALSIMDIKDVETKAGTKHDWRKDLIDTLLAKQSENGSWINSDKRWMEGDARLVTAYALLALGHAMK